MLAHPLAGTFRTPTHEPLSARGPSSHLELSPGASASDEPGGRRSVERSALRRSRFDVRVLSESSSATPPSAAKSSAAGACTTARSAATGTASAAAASAAAAHTAAALTPPPAIMARRDTGSRRIVPLATRVGPTPLFPRHPPPQPHFHRARVQAVTLFPPPPLRALARRPPPSNSYPQAGRPARRRRPRGGTRSASVAPAHAHPPASALRPPNSGFLPSLMKVGTASPRRKSSRVSNRFSLGRLSNGRFGRRGVGATGTMMVFGVRKLRNRV